MDLSVGGWFLGGCVDGCVRWLVVEWMHILMCR